MRRQRENPATDPYAVLGVPPTATPDEITRAYRCQLRTHHPDVRGHEHPSADERLREILSAYALLRDPQRRAAYDRRAGTARGAPVRVAVKRVASTAQGPPLWAGPVRWHRGS